MTSWANAEAEKWDLFVAYEGELRGFPSVCGLSLAVALVPGRLHILRRGRWTRGTVEEADYEPLRDRLIADIKGWTDPESGQPICTQVFRREEIFTGPYVDSAPDIVAHPHNGYDLKAALDQQEMFTSSPINGMHTREDAMVLLRGHTLADDSPCIWDVMPTLLRLLDVDAPGDLDGSCLVFPWR